MSDADAAGEIARSTETLRAFSPVRAFRAPYLRLPRRHLATLRASGYAIDSSEGSYKGLGLRAREDAGLTRVPASVTSSVLRLPRALRSLLLAPLRTPAVLFVHPWELVDLRRAPVRWDCRAGTGPRAAAAIADVLRDLRVHGATYHTLSALVEERRREDPRDPAHEGDRDAAHG
jgi:hypothetical protein